MESKAKVLAERIAGEFLRNGNFTGAGAAMDTRTLSSVLPAAAEADIPDFGGYGFAGLRVQSVGYTHGAETEVVYVYVTHGSKRSLSRIAADMDGVPVRVINVGNLIVRPEAAATSGTDGDIIYEHNDRIACGSSCAPAGANYAGTFGALVRSDGELMALSNNHVLATCNQVPVGQPVLTPSAIDARPELPAPRELGRHTRIVELRSGTPALVPMARCDAAVASIPEENTVSSWQGDDVNGYDTPIATIAPTSGLRVKKAGRTTGITFGTVESRIPTPMPIPYKYPAFTASVWFTDIWAVRADGIGEFALPGDSGSLVVTENGEAAVGLLFAVSAKAEYAYIAPIDVVLSDLSSTLVGGHGI